MDGNDEQRPRRRLPSVTRAMMMKSKRSPNDNAGSSSDRSARFIPARYFPEHSTHSNPEVARGNIAGEQARRNSEPNQERGNIEAELGRQNGEAESRRRNRNMQYAAQQPGRMPTQNRLPEDRESFFRHEIHNIRNQLTVLGMKMSAMLGGGQRAGYRRDVAIILYESRAHIQEIFRRVQLLQNEISHLRHNMAIMQEEFNIQQIIEDIEGIREQIDRVEYSLGRY